MSLEKKIDNVSAILKQVLSRWKCATQIPYHHHCPSRRSLLIQSLSFLIPGRYSASRETFPGVNLTLKDVVFIAIAPIHKRVSSIWQAVWEIKSWLSPDTAKSRHVRWPKLSNSLTNRVWDNVSFSSKHSSRTPRALSSNSLENKQINSNKTWCAADQQSERVED